MRGKLWTPEEDAAVRQKYSTKGGPTTLGKELGRSRRSINSRALELGITKPAQPDWPIVDDTLLTEGYGYLDKEEIMSRLSVKRTWDAVGIRAVKLGLTDPHGWTPEQDSILRGRYLAEGNSRALQKQLNRTRAAINARVGKLGLSEKERKWDKQEDQILQDRYPSEGASTGLQTTLNRTEQSIWGRANLLGVKNVRKRTIYQKGKYSIKWKGFEEVPGQYLATLKAGARHRRIAVFITAEDIYKQWLLQKGLCFYSGREIRFTNRTASVDRIDSSLGYTVDNIQIVHKNVNYMKNSLTHAEFLDFIKDIAKVHLQ